MQSNPSEAKMYLEDLVKGAKFRSGEHVLDAAQIVHFAQQFDPQPFHLDDEAARGTFFKGLAASGWHTAAITMRLLVESLPLSHGLIGAGAEISWPNPTRPGDVLHVETEILDIKPSQSRPGRAMVSVLHLTLNAHGAICQRSVTKVLAFAKARYP